MKNIASDVAKLRDWFDHNGARLDANPSLITDAYRLIDAIQAPRAGSPDKLEAAILDLIQIVADLAVAIGALTTAVEPATPAELEQLVAENLVAATQ